MRAGCSKDHLYSYLSSTLGFDVTFHRVSPIFDISSSTVAGYLHKVRRVVELFTVPSPNLYVTRTPSAAAFMAASALVS